MNKKRREFLKKGLTAAGVCAFGSAMITALSSCEEDWGKPPLLLGIEVKVDISKYPIMQYVGGGILLKDYPFVNNAIPFILVRLSETEIVCFSSLCTHANCYGDDMRLPIPYRTDIVCYCHGSRFDPFNDGKPKKGPAERPLKKFKTEFDTESNILTIFF